MLQKYTNMEGQTAARVSWQRHGMSCKDTGVCRVTWRGTGKEVLRNPQVWSDVDDADWSQDVATVVTDEHVKSFLPRPLSLDGSLGFI